MISKSPALHWANTAVNRSGLCNPCAAAMRWRYRYCSRSYSRQALRGQADGATAWPGGLESAPTAPVRLPTSWAALNAIRVPLGRRFGSACAQHPNNRRE